MSKPKLTKEQILFWIYKFRKLNPKRLDHRRRLVNSFINSIYLYDDKMVITFNYSEGTETITFDEINAINKMSARSDLTSSAAPKKDTSLWDVSFFAVKSRDSNRTRQRRETVRWTVSLSACKQAKPVRLQMFNKKRSRAKHPRFKKNYIPLGCILFCCKERDSNRTL